MSNTANLGLSTPTAGDPSFRNSWATNIVNPNMGFIDDYTAGGLSKSVAGSSNVVLTYSDAASCESRHSNFVFTGILTGNIYVLWPNGKEMNFSVSNQTTGAFTLSLGVNDGSGSPAGTTVAVTNDSAFKQFRSDGTNVVPLVTALPSIANGTMLANETGSSGLPVATAIPTFNSQIFTASGTFTVPSNANSNTVFKITAVGGGGGGGGIPVGTERGANGGGSGGCGLGYFSGFSAGGIVTITIGGGGSAGSSSGGKGGDGGNTTVVYNTATIITASKGIGGSGTAPDASATGLRGSATITASTSGLTLSSSTNLGAQSGERGNFTSAAGFVQSGSGGGNPFGSGGFGPSTAEGAGGDGINGSGGGGAFGGTLARAGGAGGAGIVIVEWVL